MATLPTFNRTRNDTMQPPSENNRSNNSNFGPDNGNGSQAQVSLFDETPDAMFYLLATLVIPSLLCFLFLFYNFFRLPHLIKKSTNFFIISLLTINFIHVSYSSSFTLSDSSSFSLISYYSIYHFVSISFHKIKFSSNIHSFVSFGHAMTIF